jgi:hypothetical protein
VERGRGPSTILADEERRAHIVHSGEMLSWSAVQLEGGDRIAAGARFGAGVEVAKGEDALDDTGMYQ